MAEVGLGYRIMVDDRELLASFQRIHGRITDLNNTFERETSGIQSSIGNIAKAFGGIFAIGQLKNFAQAVTQVRGEFQQLEIAFETMLGSKAKADALMQQLIDTAAKTPFDLQNVAQGAKQLLAYGSASEEVNDTLIRLGNIASGLSIPLGDLVYLYGTTQTQGRVFTQDMRQFMGRGIPLAAELAKQFGKTTTEINEMVSAGQIGFEHVKVAIENMTNEGGKFHQLMEKQSTSLTGQISNLGDAWSSMLNEIGQSSEGVISSAIGGAKTLVENYEKVGKILLSLVATYGAYKAAVIAVTIAQNIAKQATTGYTIAQQLQYKWLLMVEKAQKLLNATMLKNPYVLAAVAVVGLVSAIWALHNVVTAEEKAQKRLNDELDRQKEARDTAASNAEKYFGIIKDGTQTIAAQLTALKALKEELPKVFDKMSLKDIQKMTLEEFSIKINVATDEKKLADAVQTYEDAKNKILRIRKDIEIAYRTPDSGTYVSSLNSELKDTEAFAELAKKSLDELYSIRREAEFEAKTNDEKLAYYNRELDALRNRRNEIQAILRESENVSELWKADPFASNKNRAMLQFILNKIADFEGKKGALPVGNTNQTVAERVKELNQQIKVEEHKLTSFQLPTAIANPEEIKKATDNLQNYRKELQLLTGEKPSKAQKPKKEDTLIAERKNIQDQIALWERYFKYVEHGYIDMAGNTYAQLAQQADTLDAYLEKTERSLRERLTQVGLSDEGRQKLQDSLDIVIEAQIKVNRDKNQEEKELESFLKEYGTFTQKKLEIDREYDKRRKILEESTVIDHKNDAFQILDEQQQKELDELALSALKAEGVFEKLGGNIKKLSKEALKKLMDDLNRLKLDKRFADSAEAVKAIDDALASVNATLAENTAEGAEKLKQALSDVVGIVADIADGFEFADENINKTISSFSKIANGLVSGGLMGGIAAAASEFVAAANEIFDLDGSQKREKQEVERVNILKQQNYEFERQIELLDEINRLTGAERLEGRAKSIEEITKSEQETLNDIRGKDMFVGFKDEKEWFQFWKSNEKNFVPNLSKVFEGMTDEELLKADAQDLADHYNRYIQEALERGEIHNGRTVQVSEILDNEELMTSLQRLKGYAEAKRQLEEDQFQDTFGFGYNDLIGDFIGTLDAAKDDVDAFGKSFEDVWQKYVNNTIKRTVAEDAMKKLQEQFKEFYGNDHQIDDSEYKAMKDYWIELGETAKAQMATMDSVMVDSSIADETGTEPKSLSGQVKTITEETGSLIAGQFNAMRIYQADLLELQKRQHADQINLVDLTRQSVTVLRDSLIYHRETAQNTAMLYEMTDILKEIASSQAKPETSYPRSQGNNGY